MSSDEISALVSAFNGMLDRGTIPIRAEPIDLDLLISGLIEQCTPIALSKGVQVTVDLPHPFRIYSDTDQLV